MSKDRAAARASLLAPPGRHRCRAAPTPSCRSASAWLLWHSHRFRTARPTRRQGCLSSPLSCAARMASPTAVRLPRPEPCRQATQLSRRSARWRVHGSKRTLHWKDASAQATQCSTVHLVGGRHLKSSVRSLPLGASLGDSPSDLEAEGGTPSEIVPDGSPSSESESSSSSISSTGCVGAAAACRVLSAASCSSRCSSSRCFSCLRLSS